MRKMIQGALLLIVVFHSLNLLAQAESEPKMGRSEQCKLYGLYQISTGDWQTCSPEDFDSEPRLVNEVSPQEESPDTEFEIDDEES